MNAEAGRAQSGAEGTGMGKEETATAGASSVSVRAVEPVSAPAAASVEPEGAGAAEFVQGSAGITERIAAARESMKNRDNPIVARAKVSTAERLVKLVKAEERAELEKQLAVVRGEVEKYTAGWTAPK